MKVTIEDAGLGDEPIVYEFDTVEVSVEVHSFPFHGETIIKYRYGLRQLMGDSPVATAAVAPATTHHEA